MRIQSIRRRDASRGCYVVTAKLSRRGGGMKKWAEPQMRRGARWGGGVDFQLGNRSGWRPIGCCSSSWLKPTTTKKKPFMLKFFHMSAVSDFPSRLASAAPLVPPSYRTAADGKISFAVTRFCFCVLVFPIGRPGNQTVASGPM